MPSTSNMALPLLEPSQAQKHVTVNEALVLLDAAAQLVLRAVDQTVPPLGPVEGDVYGIPAGATGDWTGQDGRIAIWSNGGWDFAHPRTGWRGWDETTGRAVVFQGDVWRAEGLSLGPSGAGVGFVTEEAEHIVQAGAQNVLGVSVPANVTLFGVSARVLDPITGTATSWRLGHAGASDRFGSGLGLAAGSYADGILGQPQAYYAAEALVIEGEGGELASGRLRLALHFIAYTLPGS